MSRETEATSYVSKDTDLLEEIVASAERRLEAQLTSSLAADQRALVLAGFLVAVIVALVSAAAALLLQTPSQSFLGAVAMFAAGGLFVSLSITVYTARPVKWGYPGTRPKSYIGDISQGKAKADRLAELAADAEAKADENAKIGDKHGRCIQAALVIAWVTVLGSGAATLVLFCRT